MPCQSLLTLGLVQNASLPDVGSFFIEENHNFDHERCLHYLHVYKCASYLALLTSILQFEYAAHLPTM